MEFGDGYLYTDMHMLYSRHIASNEVTKAPYTGKVLSQIYSIGLL